MMRSSPSLPCAFKSGTNRLCDPIPFGVRRRDDECGLHLAAPLLFGNCRQISGGQLLVAFAVNNLFDPAELVKFFECLIRPAFA